MKKNILLVFGLVAVAAMLFASGNKEKIVKPKIGFNVGDKATDFKLKNVDGRTISMADYKEAKGYIVVFTCNTCPFSKMYEKRIDLLNQKYESKGYPVIAINSNDVTKQPGDSFDEMVKRSNDKGYSFPYLYDESQAVATAYGATRTPHVYVLNKNLKVSYIGAIDDNHKDAKAVTKKYVEDAVDSMLAGKAVKTSSTKAIGCTIKWKDV
ncbi:MAG: thioredoxin family protein [Reichenbachiella sp.]|uniref:thioredoxin family protein n=1 Tax=Reichenbachiella sp. TaxID=2184521 RepID=UPI0029664092|nr:thioredoxin family protein [Reichenbachiella sp.]MDW3211968.1 thioredoxin family protein [Reichenbachiella sp.]